MRTALVVLLLLAGTAAADDRPPPASSPRFAVEILAGTAIVVPAARYLVRGGCDEGTCVVGTYALGVTAASVGVYIVGAAGDQTGSYAATLGGALLGGIVGWYASDATDHDAATVLLLAAPPAIGAALGMTFSRRYDVQPLVDAHGGGLAIGGRF